MNESMARSGFNRRKVKEIQLLVSAITAVKFHLRDLHALLVQVRNDDNFMAFSKNLFIFPNGQKLTTQTFVARE